eukprot:997726-Rhodomonas_salina.1
MQGERRVLGCEIKEENTRQEEKQESDVRRHTQTRMNERKRARLRLCLESRMVLEGVLACAACACSSSSSSSSSSDDDAASSSFAGAAAGAALPRSMVYAPAGVAHTTYQRSHLQRARWRSTLPARQYQRSKELRLGVSSLPGSARCPISIVPGTENENSPPVPDAGPAVQHVSTAQY